MTEMSATSVSQQSETHQACQYHTHPCFSNEKFRKVMCVLEKISLVALAVIAAYYAPKLFFPFFGFGILLGAYLHWNKKIAPVDHKHEDGGCSQGFLEQLTGVQLPPPLGLAANVAMTICHIEHHSNVFAPLIGLNFGMWIGKLIGTHAPDIYRRIKGTDLTNAQTAV